MNRKEELTILISNLLEKIHSATNEHWSTNIDDINYMMQQVDKLSTTLRVYQDELRSIK